ncbi:hypothetical protein CIT292_09518 [Citrobacter youngae ATCC 29220]|uniref:Uncharacterized protein n=1 Tax=Citrobacter youngae ATCC 29220 TaxID=500640 RepID=D4BG72_9ENTR|nr:hypothetical protein CIT292_09518 [Citrobacter youngae ATCC 29220]
MKVNDNVNENYYYNESIIFETPLRAQAIRDHGKTKGLRNNQMKRKG